MGIAEIEGNDIRHVSDNEASCSFFGKPSELMQGRLASELGIDRETIDLWIGHYRHSERSGKAVTFEYQFREPQLKKYFSVTVSFMGKTDMGHSRFSYIVQDISETRLIQLELEKRIGQRTAELEIERTKLHSLLNASPVGIAFLDKNLKFEIINPVLATFNGKSPAEHLNKTINEVIPTYADQLVPALKSVIDSGKKIVNWEYESFTEINRDTKHAFIANYFPVQVDNNIIGVGVVVIDVTPQADARKNVQNIAKELENEKHKLEAIFQKSPAVIALWRGKDMIFEKANPEYRKICGNRDVVGKKLLDALPELKGQGFDKLILNVFETGVPYVGKEELAKMISVEGEPPKDFYFDFSYVQIRDSSGAPYGVYTHAIDVTDKVMARRALEENKKMLETTVNGLKSERDLRDYFVASLSHDMRTPLTAAKMSAQILNKHPGDREFVHRSATRIIDNMNRADSMIRDLLDANSIKAGEKLPLEIGHCNLNNLVSETLDEFNAVHGERFIFRSKEMIEGNWSCSGLRRILENLCNNAIKYGAPQSPITVTIEKKNTWVSLMVHNEGNPIPASDQQKLFEPFRRAQSAQESLQKGWGLGLTLVKGLTEAHGGIVKVESSKEAGTTFIVRIPVKETY